MSAWSKYGWQSLAALAAGLYLFYTAESPAETQLIVPFFKDIALPLGAWYVLVVLVYPFKKAWTEQKLPGAPQLHFAAPSDAFMAYIRQSLIAGAEFYA